jgi:hypothetical protein
MQEPLVVAAADVTGLSSALSAVAVFDDTPHCCAWNVTVRDSPARTSPSDHVSVGGDVGAFVVHPPVQDRNVKTPPGNVSVSVTEWAVAFPALV